MKLTRHTTIAAALILSAFTAFAQDDFGNFDDFGDFGSSSDSGTSSMSAASGVKVSGEVDISARTYFDTDAAEKGINPGSKPGDFDLKANPSAKLGFSYSGSKADAEIKLKFNRASLGEFREDILDEAFVKGYFCDNAVTVEAGKMRTIWGKGDRVHVLDNFNSDDYTDFLNPLYLDRRIAIPMLKTTVSLPSNNMAVEGIWTPWMEADRTASGGRWLPAKVANLTSKVKTDAVASVVGVSQNPAAYTIALNQASSLEDNLYPDTEKFKYSQAGLRLTGTFGMVDLGASYYYGHYKQVTMNALDYKTFIPQYMAGGNPEKFLHFDKKQTFGLEASTILWHFNLRGELAYNLTDDTAGDDPWVHNNSVQWLAGFDIDLPINNVNLNVQEVGTYILNNDQIGGIFETYDADYDVNGKYTNNRLVINITDSWLNGKIKPEATCIWGIERGDLVVMPKVDFCPNQDITFYINGLYMWAKNEDAEFAEWSYYNNNSFAGLGVKCKF